MEDVLEIDTKAGGINRYVHVNGQWPNDMPKVTGQEAIAGAKRLYRHFMKRAYKGKWKLTSGRRHTQQRSMVFYVNPAKSEGYTGWKDIVHAMSHYVHSRLHPEGKGHGAGHSYLEREMIDYVLAQGWLDGKLKRATKPKPAVIDIRYTRVCNGLVKWQSKLKRANTAIKKLKRQKAYYERKAQTQKGNGQ